MHVCKQCFSSLNVNSPAYHKLPAPGGQHRHWKVSSRDGEKSSGKNMRYSGEAELFQKLWTLVSSHSGTERGPAASATAGAHSTSVLARALEKTLQLCTCRGTKSGSSSRLDITCAEYLQNGNISLFIPRTCDLWNVLPSSCFPKS